MNVVSYCLFGTRDFYWQCIPAIIRAHHNLFPSWELWLHHDPRIDIDPRGAMLKKYAAHGLLKLVPCGEVKAIGISALWRFKPIWEPGVDYIVSRDIDSLPLPKDRRTVEVFLQSGKAAHCITDHPEHRVVGNSGFMAGMCGFHAPRVRQLTEIPSWDEFVSHGENMEVWSGGPDQQLIYRLLYLPLSPYTCYHRLGTKLVGPWIFNHIDPIPLADVTERVQSEGDALMPFMGCPGFDVAKAIAFYDQHGHPEVSSRIHKIENE